MSTDGTLLRDTVAAILRPSTEAPGLSVADITNAAEDATGSFLTMAGVGAVLNALAADGQAVCVQHRWSAAGPAPQSSAGARL